MDVLVVVLLIVALVLFLVAAFGWTMSPRLNVMALGLAFLAAALLAPAIDALQH